MVILGIWGWGEVKPLWASRHPQTPPLVHRGGAWVVGLGEEGGAALLDLSFLLGVAAEIHGVLKG